MKKFYITVGCVLSIFGGGNIYNKYDVEITTDESKIIVFESRNDCIKTKNEVIQLFNDKKLNPDQAFLLDAFKDQKCGILLEGDLPDPIQEMTVTESGVYYSETEYEDMKNELYNKTRNHPDEISIFELREITGIINHETKKRGKLRVEIISAEGLITELEK